MPSNNVRKLLDLEAQIRNAPPPKEIDGLLGFKLLDDGTILAGGALERGGMTIDVVQHITDVKGDWIAEAKRLKTEQAFRDLFASVPESDFNEYVRIAQSQEKGAVDVTA